MKHLMTLGLLLAFSVSLQAQVTVTGTVTDRKQNPIPGARITLVGSNEEVITELDGTFTLSATSLSDKLRVEYAGMNTRTLKIKPEMAIKLTDANWWNSRPEKYEWMVGLQGAFPTTKISQTGFGLMAGWVKRFGVYAKGILNKDYIDFDIKGREDAGHGTARPLHGDTYCAYLNCTGGVMFRFGPPIYFYAGAGFMQRHIWADSTNGLPIRLDGDYCDLGSYIEGDPCGELGLMVRYGKFAINCGVSTSFNFSDNSKPYTVHAGLDFFF